MVLRVWVILGHPARFVDFSRTSTPYRCFIVNLGVLISLVVVGYPARLAVLVCTSTIYRCSIVSFGLCFYGSFGLSGGGSGTPLVRRRGLGGMPRLAWGLSG